VSDDFAPVLTILESDRTSLRELAELAGADPALFYRGCNLTGVDLRGQDLRDISFSGALLKDIVVDSQTQFSEETKATVAMAINFMDVAYGAVQGTKSVSLITELMDWLAISAGLPQHQSTPLIKQSSPVDSFVDQVRGRMCKCVDDIERSVDTPETRPKVFSTMKILLDFWEVAASANALAGTDFVFDDELLEEYEGWRSSVFENPLAVKYGKVTNDGLVKIGKRQWLDFDGALTQKHVHLEVLLVGVFLLDGEDITVNQLDSMISGYHQQLRSYFPGELPAASSKAVMF